MIWGKTIIHVNMLYITNVSQRLLYCCSWLWLSSFHNLFSKNQKSKSKIKSRPEIALLITAANFFVPETIHAHKMAGNSFP